MNNMKFRKGQAVNNTELNWLGAIVIADKTYKSTGERVISVSLNGSTYEWNPKHVAV